MKRLSTLPSSALPRRVAPGNRIDIAALDPKGPSFRGEERDKENAEEQIRVNTARLAQLQQVLYAENKRSLLLVLQGMDTSGKDGTVRSVMTGLNPMGVDIIGFKRPTEEELDHDFLWRCHKVCPRRGDIAVFNRSHYEDVLIVRVNNLIDDAECMRRYRQINDWERMLTEHGTVIVKCFLHISKDEQRERLEARLHDPLKNWKFEENDLAVRKQWNAYMGKGGVYERMLRFTSTTWAPWHVVPSDRKWYRNLAVSSLLLATLEGLSPRLRMPKPVKDWGSVRVK